MPNIEIHGFSIHTKKPKNSYDDALKLRDDIEKVIRSLALSEEAITNIIDSQANSCTTPRKHAPFIRICGTSASERARIAEALHQALPKMDIEVLSIEKFIPGNS